MILTEKERTNTDSVQEWLPLTVVVKYIKQLSIAHPNLILRIKNKSNSNNSIIRRTIHE